MFAEAGPIRCMRGQIGAARAEDSDRLRRTIAIAARGGAEIGATGIGMALRHGDDIATVHVLPLDEGELRGWLAPGAAAAVFVASEAPAKAAGLDAVAEAYGLTRAETRLLERLMLGEAIADAAASLNVAQTTAKTHLAHVLSKTGARRQTDLLNLVHRLVPPVSANVNRQEN
jgi:DNA-binding CsgD family transcriptional regulator